MNSCATINKRTNLFKSIIEIDNIVCKKNSIVEVGWIRQHDLVWICCFFSSNLEIHVLTLSKRWCNKNNQMFISLISRNKLVCKKGTHLLIYMISYAIKFRYARNSLQKIWLPLYTFDFFLIFFLRSLLFTFYFFTLNT